MMTRAQKLVEQAVPAGENTKAATGFSVCKDGLGYEEELSDSELQDFLNKAFADPKEANIALENAADIGADRLHHICIELWGAFEITHPRYQPPDMAGLSPQLSRLIHVVADLDPETGQPIDAGTQ